MVIPTTCWTSTVCRIYLKRNFPAEVQHTHAYERIRGAQLGKLSQCKTPWKVPPRPRDKRSTLAATQKHRAFSRSQLPAPHRGKSCLTFNTRGEGYQASDVRELLTSRLGDTATSLRATAAFPAAERYFTA